MRKPKKPNTPKDAPFDSSVPRWFQWTEDVHIGLVRPGTGRAFTEACRRIGVTKYVAFEKMVEFMVATGKLPSLPPPISGGTMKTANKTLSTGGLGSTWAEFKAILRDLEKHEREGTQANALGHP